MRGEYRSRSPVAVREVELPPRARRILNPLCTMRGKGGTTSACAENTVQWGTPSPKHTELPPRARRIQLLGGVVDGTRGTTSACAENTLEADAALIVAWNYLRVRGEYGSPVLETRGPLELPPRARRIQYDPELVDGVRGTTSACAENTPRRRGRAR